jgi:hypothetical protein
MKYRIALGGDPALIPSSAVSALFSIAYTDIDKQQANWPIAQVKNVVGVVGNSLSCFVKTAYSFCIWWSYI